MPHFHILAYKSHSAAAVVVSRRECDSLKVDHLIGTSAGAHLSRLVGDGIDGRSLRLGPGVGDGQRSGVAVAVVGDVGRPGAALRAVGTAQHTAVCHGGSQSGSCRRAVVGGGECRSHDIRRVATPILVVGGGGSDDRSYVIDGGEGLGVGSRAVVTVGERDGDCIFVAMAVGSDGGATSGATDGAGVAIDNHAPGVVLIGADATARGDGYGVVLASRGGAAARGGSGYGGSDSSPVGNGDNLFALAAGGVTYEDSVGAGGQIVPDIRTGVDRVVESGVAAIQTQVVGAAAVAIDGGQRYGAVVEAVAGDISMLDTRRAIDTGIGSPIHGDFGAVGGGGGEGGLKLVVGAVGRHDEGVRSGRIERRIEGLRHRRVGGHVGDGKGAVGGFVGEIDVARNGICVVRCVACSGVGGDDVDIAIGDDVAVGHAGIACTQVSLRERDDAFFITPVGHKYDVVFTYLSIVNL